MTSKLNVKSIKSFLIAISIPIIIFKLLSSYNEHAGQIIKARHPAEWKKALKPVGFKGVVSDKSGFSSIDRGLFSIEIKNVAIENQQAIPPGCTFFEYSNGTLKFAAYSETVNRWDSYGLEEGYIVEKKVNSDTLFVYTPEEQPKYVFELFDGIINDWIPRQWPKQ